MALFTQVEKSTIMSLMYLFFIRFLPVVGLKIAQIVEGLDTDYSRAWAWRETNGNSAVFDAMRAGKSVNLKPLQLEDPNNDETRMCTANDLKAAIPKL